MVLGSLAIGVSLAAILSSCGGSPSSSADTGVGCSVTVKIPTSGSALLGSVRTTVAGQSHRLDRNISTVAVPCGDQVSLSATAAYPSQHPFSGWTVGGHTSSAAQLIVTVDGLVSVSPAFFVPHAAPSPSPTAKPRPSASATASAVTLDQWVSYDAATKTVIWKVVAGYQGVNHGLSFDGEADGAMKVAVPSGWSVTVNFSNVGTTNHSAVIVTATGTTPVFPERDPQSHDGNSPRTNCHFHLCRQPSRQLPAGLPHARPRGGRDVGDLHREQRRHPQRSALGCSGDDRDHHGRRGGAEPGIDSQLSADPSARARP